MSELYKPQPRGEVRLQPIPQTMQQIIDESFNPPGKKPFFKGYEPNFYFKRVSSLRSDTNLDWEPK
jgi:hypothetical protein